MFDNSWSLRYYKNIQKQHYVCAREKALRLIVFPLGQMSDKVWGAIPTPAVFAKEELRRSIRTARPVTDQKGSDLLFLMGFGLGPTANR